MVTREDLIALAQQYNGVSVSSDKQKYIDLLGPAESKQMQDYFCDPKTSGCALTVRGLWRKIGITDSRVTGKYVFGKAIEWLVKISRDRSAWVVAGKGTFPQPGDFVLVGGDPVADGGVEHVFTVCSVEVDAAGNAVLTSVDGGQKDAMGQQCILGKTRRWTWRNGSFWDVSRTGSDPGANAPGGRKVKGWGNWELIWGKEVK